MPTKGGRDGPAKKRADAGVQGLQPLPRHRATSLRADRKRPRPMLDHLPEVRQLPSMRAMNLVPHRLQLVGAIAATVQGKDVPRRAGPHSAAR